MRVDAYSNLIPEDPKLSNYLEIGKHVLLCYKGKRYETSPKKDP